MSEGAWISARSLDDFAGLRAARYHEVPSEAWYVNCPACGALWIGFLPWPT